MTENISDARGRALEYRIVEEFKKQADSYVLVGNTDYDQKTLRWRYKAIAMLC